MKAKIYDCHTDIFPTDEEVKELCLPGAAENTCIWLLMTPEGWECCCLHKNPALLAKWERGETVAKRDGCDKVNNFQPHKYGIGEFDITQSEEERFQQGRKDAYNDMELPEKTDPFYADGWREGKLEQLEIMIQERNKKRKEEK